MNLLYDLINPSDQVTFRADSFEDALGAVLLVGDGKYGAEPIGGDGEEIPVFLFGNFEDWFRERYEITLSEFLSKHKPGISKALKSFCVGTPRDREFFELSTRLITDEKKLQEFLDFWDDKFRSSLNNITLQAHNIAVRLSGE